LLSSVLMLLIFFLGIQLCWIKWFSELPIELITKKKTFKTTTWKHVLLNAQNLVCGRLLPCCVNQPLFTLEQSQMITKLHHYWNCMVLSTQVIIMFYFSKVLFSISMFLPRGCPNPLLVSCTSTVASAK